MKRPPRESDLLWGDLLQEGYAGLFGIEEPDSEVSRSSGDIPEEKVYNGRITTRIAPHVHAQAAKLAKEQGISLNQYISDAIVAMNYQLMGIQRTVPVVVQAMDDYEAKLGGRSAQSRSSGTVTITVSPGPHSKRNLSVKGREGKPWT